MCAARATDDALEGFFRSLLGQPDTLTGFRRSCFFAPLPDPKPGTKVLAEMLMKQCLIALLRRQSERSGECYVPWLAGLGAL